MKAGSGTKRYLNTPFSPFVAKTELKANSICFFACLCYTTSAPGFDSGALFSNDLQVETGDVLY